MRPEELRCDQLVEQLTDYLDDALTPEQSELVRGHLALCDGCSAHLAQLRAAVGLIERTPPELPSPDREERLTALFREWAARR